MGEYHYFHITGKQFYWYKYFLFHFTIIDYLDTSHYVID